MNSQYVASMYGINVLQNQVPTQDYIIEWVRNPDTGAIKTTDENNDIIPEENTLLDKPRFLAKYNREENVLYIPAHNPEDDPTSFHFRKLRRQKMVVNGTPRNIFVHEPSNALFWIGKDRRAPAPELTSNNHLYSGGKRKSFHRRFHTRKYHKRKLTLRKPSSRHNTKKYKRTTKRK
jgi:hypothetical protein